MGCCAPGCSRAALLISQHSTFMYRGCIWGYIGIMEKKMETIIMPVDCSCQLLVDLGSSLTLTARVLRGVFEPLVHEGHSDGKEGASSEQRS